MLFWGIFFLVTVFVLVYVGIKIRGAVIHKRMVTLQDAFLTAVADCRTTDTALIYDIPVGDDIVYKNPMEIRGILHRDVKYDMYNKMIVNGNRKQYLEEHRPKA